MVMSELQQWLDHHPDSLPRFILPTADVIPAHAHVTAIGHIVRSFVDCGGSKGKEEKAVLQTHIGHDTGHRLKSSRLAKILQLARRALQIADLEVEVEYDCCVVAQYPIGEAVLEGQHLNFTLHRSQTQCRPQEARRAS